MEAVYVVQILPFIRIKMEVGQRILVPRILAVQIAEQPIQEVRTLERRILAVQTLERQIQGRRILVLQTQEVRTLEQPIVEQPILVLQTLEQPIQEPSTILRLLHRLDEVEKDEAFLFQRRIYVQMEICQQVFMMESVS